MKLFIWEGDGVLEDYSSGMICALGNDLQEALVNVRAACDYCMQSFPNDKPSQVVDLSAIDDSKPKAWTCWGGG